MTENEFYTYLGNKFKRLRERTGQKPSDVAKKIGVPSSLISRFENEGKKISAYRLSLLMKLFGYNSIEDVMRDEPVKKNSISLSMETA